jgi:hypothetical protein
MMNLIDVAAACVLDLGRTYWTNVQYGQVVAVASLFRDRESLEAELAIEHEVTASR